MKSESESQEREKVCEYCEDNFEFWSIQIGGELKGIRFCPMCGRKLNDVKNG